MTLLVNITIFILLLNNIIINLIKGITNLRGKDIAFNPVFFSYAILFLGKDGNNFVHLYANKTKFAEIQKHLDENKITLLEYSEIYNGLETFNEKFPN